MRGPRDRRRAQCGPGQPGNPTPPHPHHRRRRLIRARHPASFEFVQNYLKKVLTGMLGPRSTSSSPSRHRPTRSPRWPSSSRSPTPSRPGLHRSRGEGQILAARIAA
ncbi:hypothetical protein NKH18_25610 [Streptomyces sp. M10(2022)]